MKLRVLFFGLAFRAAHMSMNLSSRFPFSLSKLFKIIYSDENYNSEDVRSLGYSHIVVGKNNFTYWNAETERDGRTYWESWTSTNIDEFITQYHKDKIYGEYAPYSTFITQAMFGQYRDFAMQRKTHEYEAHKKKVQGMLSTLLNNYLNSYKHLMFKFFLKISN